MSVSESSFQFNNPSITFITFKINDNFDVDVFDGFDDINIKREITHEDNTHAIVSLEFHTGGEKSPFNLDLKMESEFNWDEALNKQDVEGEGAIEGFLKYTAPSLILSYMRPIVANITNSSKFPVYNIPFLDFRTLEESSKVESNH